MQVITTQKIVLSLKVALTFLKMIALTYWQEMHVANPHQLTHSAQIFQQLGAISKFHMPGELHEASSEPRTHKYYAQQHKTWSSR